MSRDNAKFSKSLNTESPYGSSARGRAGSATALRVSPIFSNQEGGARAEVLPVTIHKQPAAASSGGRSRSAPKDIPDHFGTKTGCYDSLFKPHTFKERSDDPAATLQEAGPESAEPVALSGGDSSDDGFFKMEL